MTSSVPSQGAPTPPDGGRPVLVSHDNQGFEIYDWCDDTCDEDCMADHKGEQ